MTEIIICSDEVDLAARAADMIAEAAGEAIQAHGRFTLALTGGSTPARTYTLMGQPERAGRIDWSRTYLFVGDERFVSPDDERSNYGMARRTLISHIPIPAEQVFSVATSMPTPVAAAEAYADTLAAAFATPAGGPPPSFDLILLGLGEDGHVASLFPGYPSLHVTDVWVTSSPPGTLPPPVDRITFTYPTINAAQRVLFLVSGASKADPVQDVLEGGATPEKRPSAGVHPTSGALTWLLDRAAAQKLKTEA